MDHYSELLFDANPVPTFVINTAHVVTHFNFACAQLLGVDAASVLGTKGLGRIFYGHERPVMADLIVLGVVSVIFLRDEQSKKKNEDAFEIKLVE